MTDLREEIEQAERDRLRELQRRADHAIRGEKKINLAALSHEIHARLRRETGSLRA